jgi:hypothetical protein
VRRTPGPPSVAQAVDDWASVQTNFALLEEVLLRHPANVLGVAELRAATDWCRARHEELMAFLEGDAESPAALDPEDDALLLRAWQRRAGPLPERPGVPLRYRHVAVDGRPIASWSELRAALGRLRIGDTVLVDVRRGTAPVRATVVVTGYRQPVVRLDTIPGATPAAKALRERWLAADR